MAIANTENLIKNPPKDEFKFFWQQYVGYQVWLRSITSKCVS